MVSMYLSRIIMLVFGTLYPAYRSYKAIKNKEVREYVKWMMYWIVFAFFTTAETFADIFISWLPLYYEIKIVFIIWLLSPATKGSSILYRRFVHPRLAKHEKQIDKYIDKARENSYATIMEVGRKGLNVAADTVVKTAITGQGALIQTLKRYSSMQELRDTTDAGDNGQSGGNVRASWYGGMLPQSAGGNFDPESDADFLQKQYDGGDRRSAGEIIHEEHGLYKSASAESLAYQRPPSASQPPSPSSSYVGSVGSADSAMRVDDRVPYDAMTLPRLYSSRPGADGGESHLSDPEVRTDSTFSYSSATLPKMRRSKAPLYESNPVMNAARASRHRRGRDKSDRS